VGSVVPSGEGALKRAFELLKKKLTEEGLFDESRKRALPEFPSHIALVSSKEAAAFSDFIKVLRGRQGGLTVSFIDTQVQGETAAQQIAEALIVANTVLEDVDAIVLVRGGGSLEDLQSFNDEGVVRAVAGSRYPIVVGVGHERDVTLADMAADVRASTPSNAAELVVKDREEIRVVVTQMRSQLRIRVNESLNKELRQVQSLVSAIQREVNSSQDRIYAVVDRLKEQKQRLIQESRLKQEKLMSYRNVLKQKVGNTVQRLVDLLQQKERLLNSLSPRNTLQRGYSISKTKSGKLIKEADQVRAKDVMITQLNKGEIQSIITTNN